MLPVLTFDVWFFVDLEFLSPIHLFYFYLKSIVSENFTFHVSSASSSNWPKGTTIWSWGGGGLVNLVGTEYLFTSWARLENLFQGKPRTEYLFSTATNFWKSKKKKKKNKKNKKKKNKKGGGAVVQGYSSGGRTWLSMFCIKFCGLLARNIAYLVAGMFW